MEPVRPQINNIILRMRIASWIPKATNTHSQYVATMAARTCLIVLLGAYSRRLDGRELVVMGYKEILKPWFLALNPNETKTSPSCSHALREGILCGVSIIQFTLDFSTE